MIKTIVTPEGCENIPMTEEEIIARQLEESIWEEQKNIKPLPSDLEIILHALELKNVITEQDKEAAKQSLIEEN